ncbi:MAG: ATP-binding protein [Myxococcales bacterium]
MAESPERRRTIWVVDDSPTDAERVRRLLADEHDVEVMHDGAVALERLASGSVADLLVLDWVMPGISGIEVCEYVRSGGSKVPQVPILLVTARDGTQEILRAFRSGANDYVSKPYIEEELKARIGALLESRRLRERAEKAEADARMLLNNAPDPIFGVDAQGMVTSVNREGLRVLERPCEEVVGTPLTTLIPGISYRNVAVGPGESFLPVPDVQLGDRIFSPLVRLLPSDSAAHTTVALRDVTARRQAEARRLDFYSIIAHDLRTPLTSVLLRLDRAFRGQHGILPAGHIDDLRKIEVNLRSLVGMINDFLELARLEGVGYKIDRRPVKLGRLVRETVEDFRPLLEKSEINWSAAGLESEVDVVGDAQRLAQVISNLVSNAIKFTPRQGTITTRLTVADEHVEVAIDDTGRGIAREELSRVFERFRSGAAPGTGEIAGTGLGLMIVREIVEAHGGLVGVESEPGVGSRFWFRLPRFVQDACASKPPG